jgi:hypothetical protein
MVTIVSAIFFVFYHTNHMCYSCNGPPGKTCLGILSEYAAAANATFLGTGSMGGPCAVMLFGIVRMCLSCTVVVRTTPLTSS